MPSFVIQKHKATTLHYDFRLEVGGVLKSWVLPKGPSTDPSEKRLAIRTDDHPLDYADFEGVIPEGEYGAGTVIVWDRGTYRNLRENQTINEGIGKGHITFSLDGKKLRGGYSLTYFRKDKNELWILVKIDDDHADARRNPVSTQTESVLTGRTIEDVEEENG